MKNVVLVVALLFVIVAISPVFNVEYAKLTEGGSQFGGTGSDLVSTIISMALGPVGSALSMVVLLVVGLLALILASVFGPVMGTWGFPGIDTIVFNQVALFDPNFLDPPGGGLVSLSGIGAIQMLIKKIYSTGYVIAGSIFVIGAMIIGIKLAVTSIAAEKAYYKELVGQWLKSLVLLFSVHIIVYGVFYINEQIVQEIYNEIKPDKIVFKTPVSSLGFAGKMVAAFSSFFSFLGAPEEPMIEGHGLFGLVTQLIIKAVIGGDLISAIAVAGLLGQTVSLCITYFKRAIVCMVLAALAPFVVAVDFLKKLL